MLKVGLTGGIGAGKSTVARRLAEHGAAVIDADVLAREVVAPGSEGLAAVVAAFGEGVLAPDGSLDRPALAAVAFADDASRTRLDAILHPRIGLRTAELTGAAPADAVVVHDVPLLVENRMGARYHLVVVVHAPAEVRVLRLVEERGMRAGDAWARVRAQADDDARRAAADVWLDNTGGPDDVLASVDVLWERRLVPFEANLQARRPAVRPTQVEVVAPDPTWAAQGARIVERVRAAAGTVAVRVDHIGPTAVPALPAQDLVDVQLVVRGLAAADDLAPALAEAGFPAREGDWWDDAPDGARLAKRVHAACDPARAVNLSVRDVEGPAWVWTLLARDWLRAHPAEAAVYAQVTAASSGTGIEEYHDRNGPWVTGALRRSQAWAETTGWRPDGG